MSKKSILGTGNFSLDAIYQREYPEGFDVNKKRNPFIDKLVSSLGALIATACVAMVGYTTTIPQPTDPKTMPIVIMGTFLVYIVPIIGWILTLIALKKTPITKEEMVEVQKKIADLKTEEE